MKLDEQINALTEAKRKADEQIIAFLDRYEGVIAVASAAPSSIRFDGTTYQFGSEQLKRVVHSLNDIKSTDIVKAVAFPGIRGSLAELEQSLYSQGITRRSEVEAKCRELMQAKAAFSHIDEVVKEFADYNSLRRSDAYGEIPIDEKLKRTIAQISEVGSKHIQHSRADAAQQFSNAVAALDVLKESWGGEGVQTNLAPLVNSLQTLKEVALATAQAHEEQAHLGLEQSADAAKARFQEMVGIPGQRWAGNQK